MEPNSDKDPKEEQENLDVHETQGSPADALSRTPEDLEKENEGLDEIDEEPVDEDGKPLKKISAAKKVFRKINVYLLFFIILIIIAGAITIVNYLNSITEPPAPNIANQELTEDALKQLANTDASVGSSSQTLTIQGSAIITGQTLARGNLNVAGNVQTGGSIQGPSLTISGSSSLGDTQINRLQIASDLAIQGNTTMRDLNVAGASSFGGAMTASQVTVTKLIMSGNAILEVPNHISFTGPSPTRTLNSGVLGSGGTASVNGSDTAGTISVNTGGSTTAGCLLRVTFQQAFARQPRVIISPVGSGAAAMQYYVDRNNTSFSICSNNAPPANQAFGFDYFVMN